MKIKTYERSSIDGNYTLSHYGSAVLIDDKRIVTNAHVVLDTDGNKPTGYYEICRSEPSKKIPICFTTAKLISYDKVVDLAILELSSPAKNIKPVTLSPTKNLSIATNVIVYGYPAIGGLSITRTEGKIWGFDKENYKFDGTIDHGNSGGGAFDADGKLVGIPYAVSSDNGVIGYIIPNAVLQDFLAKKTDNIEMFTTKIESTFATYAKSLQSLYAKPNLIKTKYVEIKDAEKNGFLLKNTTASIDGSIFTYKYVDKNDRVFFAIWCSKDAQSTWTDSIEYAKRTIEIERLNKDSAIYSTGTLDSNKNLYIVDVTDKKDNKWERWGAKVVYYKDAPMCAAIILATDFQKKDKVSFDKALAIAKKVKFSQALKYTSTYSSPFYSLSSVPKNFVLSDVAPFIRGTDIIPQINFVSDVSQEQVISDFELVKFDDVWGYMEYASSTSDSYSDPAYSFQQFFDTYKTTGYANVSDVIVTAKNNKKLIMTSSDYSDTKVFPAKYEKYVTFFYPFVTTTGEYRGYRIRFILNNNNESDIYAIRQLIESIEFPGTSPFKN
jgi:hypothetical protein